jgi:hypothetical protein
MRRYDRETIIEARHSHTERLPENFDEQIAKHVSPSHKRMSDHFTLRHGPSLKRLPKKQ